MQRRNFILSTGLFSLGTTILSGFRESVQQDEKSDIALFSTEKVAGISTSLYSAESGIFGRDSLFVMGLLCTSGNPNDNETKIKNIRSKTKYQTRINHRSNDKYKVRYIKELIDEFLKDSTLKLYIKVVHPDEGPKGLNRPSNNKIHLLKAPFYKELAKIAGIPPGQLKQCTVFAKNQSPFGPNKQFKEKFKGLSEMEYMALDARSSEMLQLVGFLTSSVRADMLSEVKNPIKKETLSYLKQKLGVDSFERGMTIKNKIYIQ